MPLKPLFRVIKTVFPIFFVLISHETRIAMVDYPCFLW